MTKHLIKLDLNQLAVLAAILGISNAGMDSIFTGRYAEVTPDSVRKYMQRRPVGDPVESAVYAFGQGFFENEEMANMFVEEAQSWMPLLRKMSVAKISSTWPQYAPFVDAVRLVETRA